MARTSGLQGVNRGGRPKARGRNEMSNYQPSSTSPNVPVSARTQATRPVTAGSGKHRGDRRDTSRAYTGNVRHPAHARNPRPDVKTRKG